MKTQSNSLLKLVKVKGKHDEIPSTMKSLTLLKNKKTFYQTRNAGHSPKSSNTKYQSTKPIWTINVLHIAIEWDDCTVQVLLHSARSGFSPAVQGKVHISTVGQGILTVLFAVCLYPTVLGLFGMSFSACTTLQTKISPPNRITKLINK